MDKAAKPPITVISIRCFLYTLYLLTRLQVEKASFHNEDKIKIIKDGQSSKATYYSHIHTLFSLYTLSLEQQDIMCNLCFLPYTGISARIFAKWLELPTLNEINDLIETGFVQTTTRHTISLHPMIKEIALSETKPSVSSCHILLDSLQKICLMHGIFVQTTTRHTISLHPMIKEIALSETKPSVSSCHILLDSLQKICLMHGMEVAYYKKLFQTIGNIIELIEKDDIPKYLLFLENAFPYMDNYNYHKGMNGIIQELTGLLKTKNIGTDSDQALLLDFQATLETKPEKAIKLEKDALAQIETITADNARLVSNLHANLGGLYRMNAHPDLAREHMEKSISLLDQFNLLHINDSIPQIVIPILQENTWKKVSHCLTNLTCFI